LRNSTLYNKSRYSRNRQTYRTGVFWCIWLTVLTVIGLYFYFYVFLIKFTYAWVLFFIFIISYFFYYFRSKVERHFFF
jgi:predicted membrane protein